MRRAHPAIRGAAGADGDNAARWHWPDGTPMASPGAHDEGARCAALRLTEARPTTSWCS